MKRNQAEEWRSWWLSNSLARFNSASKARMVVNPFKEAPRWPNTGERAEKKIKRHIKNILGTKLIILYKDNNNRTYLFPLIVSNCDL